MKFSWHKSRLPKNPISSRSIPGGKKKLIEHTLFFDRYRSNKSENASLVLEWEQHLLEMLLSTPFSFGYTVVVFLSYPCCNKVYASVVGFVHKIHRYITSAVSLSFDFVHDHTLHHSWQHQWTKSLFPLDVTIDIYSYSISSDSTRTLIFQWEETRKRSHMRQKSEK